jgi:hypothetical protein
MKSVRNKKQKSNKQAVCNFVTNPVTELEATKAQTYQETSKPLMINENNQLPLPTATIV